MDGSIPIACSVCGFQYPVDMHSYRCPACGGLFEYDEDLLYRFIAECTEDRTASLKAGLATKVSLGEGNTPLIPLEVFNRTVYFKCEHLNPTGSFKDRGTAVLVQALAGQGVREAVEDSSGNAGASFAAYAAAAGIRAKVFMPANTSGPKKQQIEAYGAEVALVEGPRSKAAEAVLQAVSDGSVYASHAWLPHGQQGIAGISGELTRFLGKAPGAVITPVGHGSMLLGLSKGFQAAASAGQIVRLPALIAVQAEACAPIHARFHGDEGASGEIEELETLAEGIRIVDPYRMDEVVRHVRMSGGTVLTVSEAEIHKGHQALSRCGLYVETTSAVIWPALEKILPDLADPVVVILTGNGLKQSSM